MEKMDSRSSNFQIEQGSVATSYEPYQSNILSTPSDLELRGIGDVRDELDLLTGEVTQRIGEAVLNGGENWKLNSSKEQPNHWCFYNDQNLAGKKLLISDRFPQSDIDGNRESIRGGGNYIFVYISKEKVDGNINSFKQWLSQNPIKYQYTKSEESVKTVDLTIQDQDGNTVPHLQAFNETTHISTSSTGLIPNVVIPATVSYPSIIKPSTLYTVKLKRSVTSGSLMINAGGTEQAVTSDCFTLTTPSTLTSQDVIFSGKGNVISEVTVVEGDQTAKEYGYFEGMQSVKMPVLTTTGKNLFDLESFSNIDNWSKYTYSSFKMQLSPNTQYVLSRKDNSGYGLDTFVCLNEKIHSHERAISWITHSTMANLNNKMINFTTNNSGIVYINAYRIETSLQKISELLKEMQIEQGSVATSYEPYQSNILSTPSDLELRGIDDVKDELNCLTGEVTERIGEIIIDENNNITFQSYCENVDEGYFKFATDYIEQPKNNNYISNKLQKINVYELTNAVGFTLIGGNGKYRYLFCIKSSELSELSLNGCKQWLAKNPITVQYQLATESVKTVDLTVVDQANQPTQLGTFENVTHVSLEAENLIPEVEMEVATNLLEDTVFTLTDAFNTLYPTAAKPVKSAILTGCTLVNIKGEETNEFKFDGRYHNDYILNPVKDNTKYLILYDLTTTDTIKIGLLKQTSANKDVAWTDSTEYITSSNGKVILNSGTGGKVIRIISSEDNTHEIKHLTIIEYQEGMENWDIPYFEGMQSVKMPVLTTTGSNLLNPNNLERGYLANGIPSNSGYQEYFRSNQMINVSSMIGQRIYFNSEYDGVKIDINRICFYDSNENFISSANGNGMVPENAKFVKVFSKATENPVNLEKIKSCLSIKNTYEPYKSNILTVNEEVTLRGIGDVRDELDCLTGEVTERVGEIELVNREWIKNETFLNPVYGTTIDNLFFDKDGNSMCDKLSRIPYDNRFNIEVGQYYTTADHIYVAHKNMSVSEFKSYIDRLSPKLQYQLKTPVVKTVDLTTVNQDGIEMKLRTFDDTTHVLLNSEGLIPTADLTVRTKIPSASSTSLLMDDISTKQEHLNTTIDEQSENVDATMIATTEIFEETL